MAERPRRDLPELLIGLVAIALALAIATPITASILGGAVRDGISNDDIRKPPLSVEQTADRIPTGKKRPAFREIPAWRVAQSFTVSTTEIDELEETAGTVDELLLKGIAVSVEGLQYLSRQLTEARFEALEKATADARRRAETIASGLGGDLGAVRKVDLGVYQIVPRNSTEVSDYGINDTASREKEVLSVVTVTFAVDR